MNPTFREANTNNRRIAKNTLLLYVRMFLTMCISIYTSRILLASLGIVDYGIYNVVGGLVGMLAFLNGSLINSSQRFLTYSLGRGQDGDLSKVFSHIFLIHASLALLVIVLCESVGIWLLEAKLVIPEERMFAARLAFQMSILSMAVGMLYVPFNALVIAHERMSFFAYLSIFEVTLKLAIAFAITSFAGDKLMLYASLIALTQACIWICYSLYCRYKFPSVRFIPNFSRAKLKEILGFVSWNTFASVAVMLMFQGINLILNVFFGPVLNAARSLALQVQHALMQLYVNFQMAINPQITKSYALDDLMRMHSLMFASVKVSFVIMWTIALPFFFVSDYVLSLWLVEVPAFTAIFMKMGLCIAVVDAISNPFIVGCMATGRIRSIMVICGSLFCLVLPITYVLFLLGLPPQYAYVVHFSITLLAFFIRLVLVDKLIRFGLWRFVRSGLFPMALVLLVSFALLYSFHLLYEEENFMKLVLVCCFSLAAVSLSSYFILLNEGERAFVTAIFRKRFRKTH